MALSDELGKLAELRANGSLTEEEFVRAKDRLLNAEQARPGTEQPHYGAEQPRYSTEQPRPDPVAAAVNTFRRSRTDRWFGGVCGGIARSTGMESWAWRLLFAALFICAGVGLLLYVLLWIFVPSE